MRKDEFNPNQRRFPSLCVPEEIVRRTDLSLGARLCYGWLFSFAAKETPLLLETVAAGIGASEKEAAKYMAELRKAGLIDAA